jgi:hypothetical protein
LTTELSKLVQPLSARSNQRVLTAPLSRYVDIIDHMAVPTKIAAQAASERLTQALAELARSGELHHCGDPSTGWMWLSDDVEDRALAIKLCRGCPVFDLCGEAASLQRERFGVWAGRDRTRSPGKVGRPPKSAVEAA